MTAKIQAEVAGAGMRAPTKRVAELVESLTALGHASTTQSGGYTS